MRRHWLGLTCAALAVFAIAETVLYMPLGMIHDTDIPFCILYVASLAAIRLWPSVGPWLVAGVWIGREYTQFIGPQSMFLGFALALALIGYRHPRLGALVAALAACSSSFIALMQGSYVPYVASSTMMYLVWYGSFVACGTLMHRMRQQERLRSQLVRDRLAFTTARELHDSTANTIAFTVAQLDRLRAGYAHSPDQSLRDGLDEALHYAEHALDQTRTLIGTLQRAADGSTATVQASGLEHEWLPQVAALVEHMDHHLNKLGFRGLSIIPDEPAAVMSAEHARMLISIMHELYGNILKHAQPDGWYVTTVGLNADHVTVSVTDIPAKSDTVERTDGHVHVHAAPSNTGTGLQRMRTMLRHHGGNVTVTQQDEEWTTTVTLPYICDDEITSPDETESQF